MLLVAEAVGALEVPKILFPPFEEAPKILFAGAADMSPLFL